MKIFFPGDGKHSGVYYISACGLQWLAGRNHIYQKDEGNNSDDYTANEK